MQCHHTSPSAKTLTLSLQGLFKSTGRQALIYSEFKEEGQGEDVAYCNEDRATYNKARYEVQRSIRRAKANYKPKLEQQFDAKNSRAVWQSIRKITGHKKRAAVDAISGSNSELPNDLKSTTFMLALIVTQCLLHRCLCHLLTIHYLLRSAYRLTKC